jgi:serine/threonine-protein kinase HipA
LPAADSQVVEFDKEISIMVARYDRMRTRAGWVRIHQEDICQAMGLAPGKKYQSEGGPSTREIVELLRSHSSAADEDVTTFSDALALNWLMAGTDAHAKNYSLLIGPGRTRLAPLYDVASVLPYPRFDLERAKLAMKIGGQYRLRSIGLREWRKLAAELGLDSIATIDRVVRMAHSIPDLTREVANRAKAAGLKHEVIERLSTRLIARARRCLTQLRTTATGLR